MKYIITVLSILSFSLHIAAQHKLEKPLNMPRTGDVLVKQQIEFKDPGRKGANVLWDFSKQEIINNNYKVSYPDYGDSLIVAREKRKLFKYIFKGDSLLFAGLENATTLVNNHYPELQLIYPVCYGDRQQDYFHGTGDYCNQLDLTMSGKSSYHADAYGMMLLPEGELLENVLRIHHSRKLIEKQTPHYSFSVPDTICSPTGIDDYFANDSVYKQIDTYKWYAEGYRYPVFETIITGIYENNRLLSQPEKTSFYYPANEQNYGLENDPENQEIRERIVADKERKEQPVENSNSPGIKQMNYNVFLSSGKNELIVEYHLQEEMEVSFRLFNIQGKLLFQCPKGYKNAGYYSMVIPIDGTFTKEYLLQIEANGETYGEKILNH